MSTPSASSTGPVGPFSQHTRGNLTYYPYILHNILSARWLPLFAENIPSETI